MTLHLDGNPVRLTADFSAEHIWSAQRKNLSTENPVSGTAGYKWKGHFKDEGEIFSYIKTERICCLKTHLTRNTKGSSSG